MFNQLDFFILNRFFSTFVVIPLNYGFLNLFSILWWFKFLNKLKEFKIIIILINYNLNLTTGVLCEACNFLYQSDSVRVLSDGLINVNSTFSLHTLFFISYHFKNYNKYILS